MRNGSLTNFKRSVLDDQVAGRHDPGGGASATASDNYALVFNSNPNLDTGDDALTEQLLGFAAA